METVKEKPEEIVLRNLLYKIIDLEIPSCLSQPKAAKRKLQKILKEHGIDEDFIESINVDTMGGYYTAIYIIKEIVSDKLHEMWERENENSKRKADDLQRV